MGYLAFMKVASTKQSRPQPASVNGREGTGRVLSPEFLARQFKPGQSGNPNGNKGSTYGEVVKIARQHSEKAIRRLIELMGSDDERVAFMAAQAVLDRGYGKPKETGEVLPVVDAQAGERRAKARAMIMRMLDEKAAGLAYDANRTAGI
jgi:hypothetical protein